jgi:hypothetical protein
MEGSCVAPRELLYSPSCTFYNVLGVSGTAYWLFLVLRTGFTWYDILVVSDTEDLRQSLGEEGGLYWLYLYMHWLYLVLCNGYT